jgi:hypothetical protein
MPSLRALFGASLLLVLTPALGSAQNKCAGAKIKAACKKASCKASLEAKQAGYGILDPARIAKCEATFSKAFAKSEAKGGCATTGDTAAIEAKADAFVADLDAELDVPTGTTPNKCEAEKIRAAARKASCECSLEAKQAEKGGTIDGNRRARCYAYFYTGFARSEEKGGCNTTGDAFVINNKVVTFVMDVDAELAPAPTTSTTSATTSTSTTTLIPPVPCADSFPTCGGSCPVGQFCAYSTSTAGCACHPGSQCSAGACAAAGGGQGQCSGCPSGYTCFCDRFGSCFCTAGQCSPGCSCPAGGVCVAS